MSLEATKKRVESFLRKRAIELSRCVKACFLDGNGIATPESERVIADLRKFASLDRHSFLRDLTGKIDPLSMARIEGRREVVQRIINFLELEPSEVRRFVEVDNGTE